MVEAQQANQIERACHSLDVAMVRDALTPACLILAAYLDHGLNGGLCSKAMESLQCSSLPQPKLTYADKMLTQILMRACTGHIWSLVWNGGG